jgi:hypothetical protein
MPAMMSPEETAPFRNMTPANKLRMLASIHTQARTWKRAAFKAQHPDWTSANIDQQVKEVFLYGAS